MIDIRNFVDVNIVDKTMISTVTTRDIMVLFTEESISADSAANHNNIFDSLSSFNAVYPLPGEGQTDAYEITRAYLDVFFKNGGLKVKLVYAASNITSTALQSAIEALPNEYIVIAGTTSLATTIASVAEAAEWTGIKKKILLRRIAAIPERSVFPNYLVEKYSTVIGAEMTIGAYLTQINMNNVDTVQDYCFTSEKLSVDVDDDTTLDALQSQKVNVDIELANSIRNIGGNMINGLDLVNEYTLIVLQQTVTDAVLQALLRKLKGETGLAAIRTAITEELQKYVTNGYLTTDKVWPNQDYSVTVKEKDYVIVEANTPITKGYIIKILPLSSLTNEEKDERKTPRIYIILADMYGFRKVEIAGEVY